MAVQPDLPGVDWDAGRKEKRGSSGRRTDWWLLAHPIKGFALGCWVLLCLFLPGIFMFLTALVADRERK